MAVTIDVAALAVAMRIGTSDDETAEATRLLAYASTVVTTHAPGAPDVVMNEAVVRLAAYLYDRPNAGRDERYANAMRNSGAASMLFHYRNHRAKSVDGERHAT